MAEENTKTIETNVTENPTPATENKLDESINQLNALKAEMERLKAANDKLSKEAAENKRQLRAKQSEEEKRADELAEAQRVRDEEYELMKQELNHNKAVNAYRAIPDGNMVENLVSAISNADHNEIASIINKLIDAKVKEAQAEWQKSRPRVNVGVGDGGFTKEQFENMSMAEKSKLYRENKAEYDRLLNI
jgi:hypothetical protein